MLRERVITAVVLLALLVGALAASSPLPFALLTIVLIGAAGWEWGRLCGLTRVAAIASGVVLGLACLAIAPLGGGIGGVEFPAEAWAPSPRCGSSAARSRCARARMASRNSIPSCDSWSAGC